MEHLPQRSPRGSLLSETRERGQNLLILPSGHSFTVAEWDKPTRRSTNETSRRCQDWLNAVRLELWDLSKHTPARNPRKRDKTEVAPACSAVPELHSWGLRGLH